MSAAGQNELLACVHQKTVKPYSDKRKCLLFNKLDFM